MEGPDAYGEDPMRMTVVSSLIECSVDVRKTARARQMKGVLLPVVAPALLA